MDLSPGELLDQIMRLPRGLQALLANRIAESLSADESDEIQPLWILEAARRLEEIDSGKVKTIPGDQVMAEVRQILLD